MVRQHIIVVVLVFLIFTNKAMGLFPGELKIQDIPSGSTVTLTAIGTGWYGYADNWAILTDNNVLNITLSGNTTYYLDFIADDAPGTGPHGTICYALYEIKMGANVAEFDWRDSDFFDGTGGVGSHYYDEKDVRIRWNASQSRWERRNLELDWEDISATGSGAIWKGGFKNAGYPANPNRFQPTTPTSLQVTSSYNYPRVTWVASEPSDGVTYEVERKRSGQSWQNIASGLTSTFYVDTDISTGGIPKYTYFYHARALSGNG